MIDWRGRLRAIFEQRDRDRRAGEPAPGEQRPAADFIRGTVAPAFEALKEELEGYGREVLVRQWENQASISVHHRGEEEFTYLVRLRAFHKADFAFPELPEEGDAPSYKVEVLVHDELQEKRDPGEFTQEGIIADFLELYAKWAGW